MVDARPPIIVTGAARSGTSVTANVIHAAGAWGGDLIGPHKTNPKGFFENKPIREDVVKPYLDRMGVDRLGQKALPTDEHLLSTPYPELRRDIEKMITDQGYLGGPWFTKDAKYTLIWRAMDKAFPDARWVVVRRPRENIVASCVKTGFMLGRKSESGWEKWVDEYESRLNVLTSTVKHSIESWTDDLMRADENKIQLLADFLGLPITVDIVSSVIIRRAWHFSDGGPR